MHVTFFEETLQHIELVRYLRPAYLSTLLAKPSEGAIPILSVEIVKQNGLVDMEIL